MQITSVLCAMNSFWNTPIRTLKSLLRGKVPQIREVRHFHSHALNREMSIDIYLPPDYSQNQNHKYPLVVFNDGQDLPRMHFRDMLANLYKKKYIPQLIVVGIYADHDRMNVYGTAHTPDYKGRGNKAGHHKAFVMQELLPYLSNRFRISAVTSETVFAGFSLGGLSAFDIGYSVPEIFGVVGVFSGSFWWRKYEAPPHDPDAGRIMRDLVLHGGMWDGNQRYWFQCGALDEEEDRNRNGVIDAIDDTRDMIMALAQKGVPQAAMRYVELPTGRHDQKTWAEAMTDFLFWAFSSQREMD